MYFYRVDETVCCSFQQLDLPPAAADARARVSAFLFERPLERSRAHFAVNDALLLYQQEEDAGWLSLRVLAERAARVQAQLGAVDAEVHDAIARGRLRAVNLRHPRWRELLTAAETLAPGKKRVHLLALGDVGSHILIGLRLLGGNVISRIGICDLNAKIAARWEFEANQIAPAFALDALPPVERIKNGKPNEVIAVYSSA